MPAETLSDRAYPTPRQRHLLWSALTALALLALIGFVGLIFLGFISFLGWAYPIILPLGLAIIVALVLEPLVDLLQRLGLSRGSGSLAACFFAGVLFLLFWIFLLPPILGEAGTLLISLPGLINEGVDKVENFGFTDATPGAAPAAPAPATNAAGLAGSTNGAPGAAGATTNKIVVPVAPAPHGRHRPPPPRRIFVTHSPMQDWVKTNLPLVQSAIENSLARLVYSAAGPVGQALGFILGFGFVPIYVYYFLADQRDIEGHWQDYVPLRESPMRREVVSVLGEINLVLVRYFRGQIVVAACNGLLTSIGLMVIGIPYGLILGIMTGALSIVPFLGIIASILPALLLGFLADPGWLKPLEVLLVFAVVQISESTLITPRVQSHTTGLHPLTIILGILFWSLLLPGILGPVMAVPLTCAIVVLMRRYVWEKKPAARPTAAT